MPESLYQQEIYREPYPLYKSQTLSPKQRLALRKAERVEREIREYRKTERKILRSQTIAEIRNLLGG